MKNRVRFILLCLAAIVFAGSFQIRSSAQRRDQFSHNTAAHKKKDCKSCHSMPTGNWVAARGYPDVAKFPGHIACASCHRSDFFKPGSAFCAGCHVSSSNPRSAPLFAFPVRTRSHEFSTIFPHNAHQDIIASNTRKTDVAVAHFVKASFAPVADDPPQFNNCAICHATTEKLPKYGSRTPDSTLKPLADPATDIFEPGKEIAAKLFKDSPNNHASCFTCHYQSVKPLASNCAGCHSLTKPYIERPGIQRYSLRFDHASTNHASRDCMTCHVRITQNADVRTLKDADVPILTCSTSSCHGAGANGVPRTDAKYLPSAIQNEIASREDAIVAKQPVFQCTFCHTSAIGRFEIPKSHLAR
jgi:hypothetical protein